MRTWSSKRPPRRKRGVALMSIARRLFLYNWGTVVKVRHTPQRVIFGCVNCDHNGDAGFDRIVDSVYNLVYKMQ